MSTRKLLTIKPDVLNFPFELNKKSSSTIQLTNNTTSDVTFKILTSSPPNYCIRPNFEILHAGSTCKATVTMQGPKELPSSMQCKDKFLIKSVLTRPGDTVKDNWEKFSEIGRVVEEFKVRVAYVFPSHIQPSNSRNAEAGSSQEMATVQQRTFDDCEVEDRNGNYLADLFVKDIVIGFLGWIIVRCIIMKLF